MRKFIHLFKINLKHQPKDQLPLNQPTNKPTMLMLLNSALSHISPSPLLPCHTTKTHQKFVTRNARASRRRWLPPTVTRVSSSDDPTVAVASSPPPPLPTTVGDDESVVVESAADVVRNFYAGINGRDLASVEDLIAENCVYEDLIFPRPFVGRKVRFHSGL